MSCELRVALSSAFLQMKSWHDYCLVRYPCSFSKANNLLLALWKPLVWFLVPMYSRMPLRWPQQQSDRGCYQRSGPVLRYWNKYSVSKVSFVTRLNQLSFALSLSRVLSYGKVVDPFFQWFSYSHVDGSPESFLIALNVVWGDCINVLPWGALCGIMSFWPLVNYLKMGHCFSRPY